MSRKYKNWDEWRHNLSKSRKKAWRKQKLKGFFTRILRRVGYIIIYFIAWVMVVFISLIFRFSYRRLKKSILTEVRGAYEDEINKKTKTTKKNV